MAVEGGEAENGGEGGDGVHHAHGAQQLVADSALQRMVS